MLLPLILVVSQVSSKGLLTPGALAGVADGRPGTDTLVLAGVLQEQRQGTMATHGMSRDGDPARIQLLEFSKDSLGQLLGQVRLHAVVLAPGVLGRVDVEARGAAKVPRLVLAGEVEPARGRVRVQQREAQRRRVRVQEALVGDVVGRARQAREVDEQGRGLGGRG